MAWKPRLSGAAELEVKKERLWVAIAEDNAADAVKLFVSIMNNHKYPVKVRMEAATRLVMIAGASFRGEKLDAQGRPAANLPGQRVARLENNALREVLRQLPPGSAALSPEVVNPGEKVVVFNDGDHARKPTGHILQAVVGKLIEKTEDGSPADPEAREELVKDFTKGTLEEVKDLPANGPALSMLESVWKKNG
jgi:hypothetical protein